MEYRKLKVEMGQGARWESTGLIYTEKIGTCMGVSFYKPTTKKGALYHIAGSEESSIEALRWVADEETRRLGPGIHAYFVSGFATKDKDSQRTILESHAKAMTILGKNKAVKKFEVDFCKTPGEYISYFSLDLSSGNVSVRKAMLSEHELELYDMLADMFG